MMTVPPKGEVCAERLLDLEEFCNWVGEAAGLSFAPEPSQSLTKDLGLDDFAYLSLVAKLDELVGSEGKFWEEIYMSVDSLRDLHLYYLQVMQEPLAQ